jgi:hypothetical protein
VIRLGRIRNCNFVPFSFFSLPFLLLHLLELDGAMSPPFFDRRPIYNLYILTKSDFLWRCGWLALEWRSLVGNGNGDGYGMEWWGSFFF